MKLILTQDLPVIGLQNAVKQTMTLDLEKFVKGDPGTYQPAVGDVLQTFATLDDKWKRLDATPVDPALHPQLKALVDAGPRLFLENSPAVAFPTAAPTAAGPGAVWYIDDTGNVCALLLDANGRITSSDPVLVAQAYDINPSAYSKGAVAYFGGMYRAAFIRNDGTLAFLSSADGLTCQVDEPATPIFAANAVRIMEQVGSQIMIVFDTPDGYLKTMVSPDGLPDTFTPYDAGAPADFAQIGATLKGNAAKLTFANAVTGEFYAQVINTETGDAYAVDHQRADALGAVIAIHAGRFYFQQSLQRVDSVSVADVLDPAITIDLDTTQGITLPKPGSIFQAAVKDGKLFSFALLTGTAGGGMRTAYVVLDLAADTASMIDVYRSVYMANVPMPVPRSGDMDCCVFTSAGMLMTYLDNRNWEHKLSIFDTQPAPLPDLSANPVPTYVYGGAAS